MMGRTHYGEDDDGMHAGLGVETATYGWVVRRRVGVLSREVR